MKYKAPKELHDVLDWAYSIIKKEREWSEKKGLPKTKARECRVLRGITPIPFKSPHEGLMIDLYEYNTPPEKND